MEAGNGLSGGSNLFWRSCPVLVRRGERGEERTKELTVRLISSGQQHGQRVLRLFLCSEADPYFLHLLEVGEEEYALLRSDQGIRVDFANFPGKLVGLLEQCIACKAEDLPKFQAVLHTAAGQGSLRVVENNDFKQLPHITLSLRSGSDAALKQWLAFRLGELQGDAAQLSAELERAQSERNSVQGGLGEARKALAEAREQHERLSLECQADAKAREAAVVEAKGRQLADLREAGLRERAELEGKYRQALEAVQARADDLEGEARALRDQKYGLDGRLSELAAKLGAAEGSNGSLRQEVEQLRASSTALGRAKAERDVELGEALTKASLRQVEARAAELKAAAQGHETRATVTAAELAKAAAQVEKLTSELELQREKAKRKAGIVARQEEELAARDRAANEASQSARGLQRDLERAHEEAEALRRDVADLKGKLEEGRATAASNEQMIRWLNSQVTEAQLGGTGCAGQPVHLASRYSYRPAALAVAPRWAPHAGGHSGAAVVHGLPAGGSAAGPAAARSAAAPAYRSLEVPSPAGGAATGLAGSAGAAARGRFRSSFYATHFGPESGSASPGRGHAAPAAQAASSISAVAGADCQPASAPASDGAAAAARPVVAPKPANSLFEAPTYCMADTAGGRVPVPVTSGAA